MRRQFRCKTKTEAKSSHQIASKILSKYKNHSENIPPYEKLSYKDIRQITRSMISDPKTLEKNMGVISSIKGEVSSSKDFSNYFYSKQFRVKNKKQEALSKISSNSMYNQYIPSTMTIK